MKIRNLTRQVLIAQDIIVADNPWSRMKGLLGRKSLSFDQALVLRPCNSVHMLFMQFAIDILFLNKENMVVGLVQELKPNHFSPVYFKAQSAIELPASTIKITNTQIGDQIEFLA